MTGKHSSDTPDGMDPLVSAEYRRLANEPAPESLNHIVLKVARTETGKRTAALWSVAWLRPMAMVAVAGLSLAFILDINDAGNPGSAVRSDDQAIAIEIPADVFRDAADSAASQIRDAEAAASRTSQNSGSDNPLSMDSGLTLDQATLLPVDQGCDAAQRSTMATWWKCVESLENRGASALAEQELSALVQAFPAFDEPGE